MFIKLAGTAMAVIMASSFAQADQWTSGASLNQARGSFGAAVDWDGRIYAIGGRIATCVGTITDTVEVFDSGVWSYGPSISSPRDGIASTGVNGFIYAIGGSNQIEPLTIVERLDTTVSGSSWITIAQLNIPRTLPCIAVDDCGRIYAIGGQTWDPSDTNNTIEAMTSVERYDPARPELGWTLLPWQLNTGRLLAGCVAAEDGRIFVFGGQGFTGIGGSGVHLDSYEVFDPSNSAAGWTQFAQPIIGPNSNQDEATLGADGLVYIAGGWLPGFSNRAVRYDPATDTWEMWDSIQTFRSEHRLITTKNGEVMVIGGTDVACTAYTLTSTEILDTNRCDLDIDKNGLIDVEDLLALLGAWGACP
ncbi:MAG: hypothetical protein O7G85_09290 [Planctomycetota bacterium]|nr:hypothetical protein [Planctomycetota bacterium]